MSAVRGLRRRRDLLGIGALVLLGGALEAKAATPMRSWVDEHGVLHVVNAKAERPISGSRVFEDVGGDGFGGQAALRIELEGVPPPTPRVSPDRFDHLFREAGEHYRLPSAFLKAVARVESNFDPAAVSHASAKGLMQLIDSTAARMNVADPFDPRQSVFGGARYLRLLINAFDGDLVRAVAAYNAGPDRVRKAGGVPQIRETQRYVRRVLEMYRRYRLAEVEP